MEIICDRSDDVRQFQEGIHGSNASAERLDELVLALRPSQVVIGMSDAHVPHCPVAVEMLSAGLKMDVEVAPVIVIIKFLVHIDVDAADGIDDLLESLEVQISVVVRSDSEDVLNCRNSQFRPAVCVRGVDLVNAMAGNPDPGVARDG